MKAPPAKQSWKGRVLKIRAVDPSEQERRIHNAIAVRAHHIFESRGSVPGHELEDWKRAEFEGVGPLGCGYLALENNISLHTDASVFAEGIIEVCVEPRRLTICGNGYSCKENATLKSNNLGPRGDTVFRVFDLPVSVDPTQARARFNGRILQIDLPRRQETVAHLHAA